MFKGRQKYGGLTVGENFCHFQVISLSHTLRKAEQRLLITEAKWVDHRAALGRQTSNHKITIPSRRLVGKPKINQAWKTNYSVSPNKVLPRLRMKPGGGEGWTGSCFPSTSDFEENQRTDSYFWVLLLRIFRFKNLKDHFNNEFSRAKSSETHMLDLIAQIFFSCWCITNLSEV